LVFAEEGNPNNYHGDDSIINFSKRELMCRFIRNVLMYQKFPFLSLSPNQPLCALLAELPTADKKELQDLSFVREPRDAQLFDLDGWEQRPSKKHHRRSRSLSQIF